MNKIGDMRLRAGQFSIVVAGSAHNPTLLNPDFLRINNIVPEDWGWTVEQPVIVTPPMAQVRYDSGVMVSVQSEKLEVVDINRGEAPPTSKSADIASRYVSVLPHVNYSAVGINFQVFVEREEADVYLSSRLMKKGPWDSEEHPLNGVGFRLVYHAGVECKVVLSIDTGTEVSKSEQSDESRDLIMARANFHRPCTSTPGVEAVVECLKCVDDDWNMFEELLVDVLVAEIG